MPCAVFRSYHGRGRPSSAVNWLLRQVPRRRAAAAFHQPGVALYDDLVYVGTLDARVVALEATTGEMVWERAVAYYRHGYYITLAPLVVDGKVMVGTSGGESSVAVSYAVRGVQYVALQLEPRPEFPDAGNRVLAFALDCQC